MRIQKYLSLCGITSRRKAEKLVLEGRVKVNNILIQQLGYKVDPEKDEISVDGQIVKPEGKRIYLAIYKPKGYLSTMYDNRNRPTVKDLIQGIPYRVFPIGRLDYHTEGLLLLTNDGDFANLIAHPSYKVHKFYKVKIDGFLAENEIQMLLEGIKLDKKLARAISVKFLNKTENNSWWLVEIDQGLNRQIHRMFNKINHRVRKLVRIQIGPIKLNGLTPGEYRYLTEKELKELNYKKTRG